MADLPAGPQLEAIRQALFAGKKIQAIKLYRAASGEGLKDAKEMVEAMERELRVAEPEKFTAAPATAKGGCVGVMVFAAVAFVGAVLWAHRWS